MHRQSSSGLTRLEALVVLVIIGIFLLILVDPHPHGSPSLIRGQQTQTLSNMKQLHLATMQMALDGETTENTKLGWPGDTGGSFSNWAALLLKGNYLTRNDLCKLLSAPGAIVSTNDPFTNNQTALLVYAVSTNSPGTAVFLTTANFTNTPIGGVLDANAKPYGKKGFVVFRKAGDGAILQARQAGMTNVIGSYVPLCH